jgi:hypothetical protein
MDVDEQNCVLVWNLEYGISITKKAAKLQNIKLMGVLTTSTSTKYNIRSMDWGVCEVQVLNASFIFNESPVVVIKMLGELSHLALKEAFTSLVNSILSSSHHSISNLIQPAL